MLNYVKIREIRKFLTRDACAPLVMGLIMSHLDYSNSILFGCTHIVLNRFQQIQNMSAKLVLGRSKYSISKEALIELHWLPIRARIDFKIICLMHKCTYRVALDYLKILLDKKIHQKDSYVTIAFKHQSI